MSLKLEDIKINKEYAKLVPPLSKEEYAQLKSSIRTNGLYLPIIINGDGVILDGHTRHDICKELEIQAKYKVKKFESITLEKIFVILVNLDRRQLADPQKYLLGEKLEPLYGELSTQKKREAGEQFGEKHPKSLLHECSKLSDKELKEHEEFTKTNDKYFANAFRKGSRVYCKHCYEKHTVSPGDGIWICNNCDAGLGRIYCKDEFKEESNNRNDRTTTARVAKAVGLKQTQYAKLKKIKKDATSKDWQNVVDGKTSVAYAYKTVNRKEKKKNAEPIPTGQFDVILADPPWKYDINTRGSPDDHYDVMNDEDISKLVIPSADNCVLFMWGTAPKLPEALQVIADWGFTYKTNMVWIKDKIGTGYYFRGKHELLLVAVKGNPLIPEEADRPESVLVAPRTTHSKKPEEIYGIIERMYPDAKYLELFARNTKENWKSWGNEIA